MGCSCLVDTVERQHALYPDQGFAIACGAMWHKTWDAQERLEYRLLDLSFLRAADSESVARVQVAGLVSAVNTQLVPFVT